MTTDPTPHPTGTAQTRREIADVVEGSRVLSAAGLDDMVWGHASVRDAEGRGVWMKASGWGLGEVDESRVVLVSPEGEVLQGEGRRHLEFPIHTEILAARPDLGAVVHIHAPAINAFSSLRVELRPISHDAVPFDHPQLPRFEETGALIASRELGRSLAATLGSARAVLMPHHGAATVGPDMGTAVMYAVLLERACRTALAAMAAGGPATWSDEAETIFKREQVWNPTQLTAGWHHLVRQLGPAAH